MKRLLLIAIIFSIGIMATGFGQGPFDSPRILSAEGEAGVLSLDTPGFPLPQTGTENGNVKDYFPGSNKGASPGAGQIEKTINGVPQGPPYFQFHTPDDNSGVELPVGTAVTFDAMGQKASNVQRDVL